MYICLLLMLVQKSCYQKSHGICWISSLRGQGESNSSKNRGEPRRETCSFHGWCCTSQRICLPFGYCQITDHLFIHQMKLCSSSKYHVCIYIYIQLKNHSSHIIRTWDCFLLAISSHNKTTPWPSHLLALQLTYMPTISNNFTELLLSRYWSSCTFKSSKLLAMDFIVWRLGSELGDTMGKYKISRSFSKLGKKRSHIWANSRWIVLFYLPYHGNFGWFPACEIQTNGGYPSPFPHPSIRFDDLWGLFTPTIGKTYNLTWMCLKIRAL